jgi:hypothetical protein
MRLPKCDGRSVHALPRTSPCLHTRRSSEEEATHLCSRAVHRQLLPWLHLSGTSTRVSIPRPDLWSAAVKGSHGSIYQHNAR